MKLINPSNVKQRLYRLLKQIDLYAQRSRTRRKLLQLDEDLLKDIGLTRQQALQEARLNFWQGDDHLLLDDCVIEPVSEEDDLIKLSQSSYKKICYSDN